MWNTPRRARGHIVGVSPAQGTCCVAQSPPFVIKAQAVEVNRGPKAFAYLARENWVDVGMECGEDSGLQWVEQTSCVAQITWKPRIALIHHEVPVNCNMCMKKLQDPRLTYSPGNSGSLFHTLGSSGRHPFSHFVNFRVCDSRQAKPCTMCLVFPYPPCHHLLLPVPCPYSVVVCPSL